jgi:hypothetical protein
MKIKRNLYMCSVTDRQVVRLRFYQEVSGIGSDSVHYELTDDRCSEDLRCAHWARCPMRQGDGAQG